MGQLTTHVLDTANGRPGSDIMIQLYRLGRERRFLGQYVTNDDGRTEVPLLDSDQFQTGTYEIVFAVGNYFNANRDDDDNPPFLNDVVVRFNIAGDEHYHVPLLVSPWSYSTYRGS